MPRIATLRDKSFLAEWPLYKFSIVRLHEALTKHTSGDFVSSIGDKLIDIKLHFAYLLTIQEHFYRGATLIVGNNEIEQLNPNTISLLRAVHYRVYLLSVLVEQLLDLVWLILDGNAANYKKGKWDKIIQRIQAETGQSLVTDVDAQLLRSFKEQYRTAELHKFSMVRALTGKDEWTHLHEEEQAVQRFMERIYAHFTQAQQGTPADVSASASHQQSRG